MQPPPPGIASNRGPGAPRPSSRLHYLRRFRPVLGRGSAPVGAGLRPSLLLQTPEERGGLPLPAWRTGSPGRALGRERKGSWCPRWRPVCVFLQSWTGQVFLRALPPRRSKEGTATWKRLLSETPGVGHLFAAAAAAAKSLQSCPTLCDPIDGSLPGSPVPGIRQARTLEWVAISFSNAWKWKVKGKSLSRVRLVATPWTAANQAPLSMGFSRQEYWSRVPLPSPGHLFRWPKSPWAILKELGYFHFQRLLEMVSERESWGCFPGCKFLCAIFRPIQALAL